jgi:hypothetical protein
VPTGDGCYQSRYNIRIRRRKVVAFTTIGVQVIKLHLRPVVVAQQLPLPVAGGQIRQLAERFVIACRLGDVNSIE